MKTFKSIVVLVLFIALAFIFFQAINGSLPSSGPEQYKEDEIKANESFYQRPLKQMEGIVKVLGVSLYGEGTHRLEKDDKLMAILESEKINLPDFVGKEVRVRGFVRDTVEGGQKIMKVLYIEQLQESGVKLFNEVGYEFSFSYPAEWELAKEADQISFLRKKGDEKELIMKVAQFENIETPFSVWLKDRDQNLPFEEASVKVGDVTGVRRTIHDGGKTILKTYVQGGKNMYELKLLASDEVTKNQYFSIVDFFRTSFSEKSQAQEELPKNETQSEVKPEVKPEPAEAPSEPISSNPPLSEEEIKRIFEKGFTAFTGKMLSFEYPKSWYFSYLGNGMYGLTDDKTYQAAGEQVTEEGSRVLIVAGVLKTQCAEKIARSLDNTEYTVCSRETGLNEIIKKISESLKR